MGEAKKGGSDSSAQYVSPVCLECFIYFWRYMYIKRRKNKLMRRMKSCLKFCQKITKK